eukprot:scaffold172715_cov33-Tisochrysis_lutea.AAC.1
MCSIAGQFVCKADPHQFSRRTCSRESHRVPRRVSCVPNAAALRAIAVVALGRYQRGPMAARAARALRRSIRKSASMGKADAATF